MKARPAAVMACVAIACVSIAWVALARGETTGPAAAGGSATALAQTSIEAIAACGSEVATAEGVAVSVERLVLPPASAAAPDQEWLDCVRTADDLAAILARDPQLATDFGLLRSRTFNPRDAWFTIPNDGRVPRGYYMLFALNSAGVPSVALWIKVLQ